jgi:hypothetical protein
VKRRGLEVVAQAAGALGAQRLDAQPGSGHEHEPLHAGGVADRELRPDEAAHRVADDPRTVDVQLGHEVVEHVRVAADRDLLGWHLGLAETREIHGDDAMIAGKRGMFSSQFFQQPDSPCTNSTTGPSPMSTMRIQRFSIHSHRMCRAQSTLIHSERASPP